MSSFSFDRTMRRVFPSLSRLTFHPFFQFIVNLGDIPGKMIYPEFRRLPPNHMRIRVGVGNRLFSNQLQYLCSATSFWIEMFNSRRIDLQSTIVEIGSGCGRIAHVLRDASTCSGRFEGAYIGVDIDREMIDWCRSHFDAQRFRFHLSSDGSKSYNRQAESPESYSIPEPDGIADLVFSASLFTHLLEPEARNYLRESFRLLRPGGFIHHSVFCLDYPPPTLGKRHTFRHKIGNASVESLAQPEASVAYSASFLLSTVAEIGFADARIHHRPGEWQPALIAQKTSG